MNFWYSLQPATLRMHRLSLCQSLYTRNMTIVTRTYNNIERNKHCSIQRMSEWPWKLCIAWQQLENSHSNNALAPVTRYSFSHWSLRCHAFTHYSIEFWPLLPSAMPQRFTKNRPCILDLEIWCGLHNFASWITELSVPCEWLAERLRTSIRERKQTNRTENGVWDEQSCERASGQLIAQTLFISKIGIFVFNCLPIGARSGCDAVARHVYIYGVCIPSPFKHSREWKWPRIMYRP